MADAKPLCAIPCANAPFIVTIDGKPYAGFVSRHAAELAVGLWSGELDEYGEPVAPQDRGKRGWAAVRGRALAIVDRSQSR